MNQKIRELADEARRHYLTLPTGYDPEKVGMYPQLMEKFAELIVRECAEIAMREDHEPAECILNHFGITNEQS